MTEALSRTSALAARHKALGSGLEDWNGMGTAWSYASDPCDEHDAVRERVGMFDMSPLKKVFLNGPDAQAVLDHLTTREMNRIAPGRAAYLSVLTDRGTLADDAIVSNNGGDEWMIVHGSGDTMALLQASAAGRQVAVRFSDELHDISVQGPQSLDVLNASCDADLSKLAYFQHTPAKLFGKACRISRTGYSGERGYEVFCDAAVAEGIWDKLQEAGVMPCSFTALDKLRIEAGLLFYGYDMTAAQTPWEVGLDFTVNKAKTGYRGHTALMAAKGKERVTNVCLDIDLDDIAPGGAALHLGGEQVGTVNSPAYSHRLRKSLALAHLRPSAAAVGTGLLLKAEGVEARATVVAMPVYDTTKARTHAA